MKAYRMIGLVAVLGLVLAACGGGGDTTSSSAATSTTSPPATANTEFEVTAPVGATNSGFQETLLEAPADTPFTIVFNNNDTGIPHNIQIFEGTDTTGTPVWAPPGNETINGVAEATYEIPALGAGTYTFNCYAHPATMVGTIEVA